MICADTINSLRRVCDGTTTDRHELTATMTAAEQEYADLGQQYYELGALISKAKDVACGLATASD